MKRIIASTSALALLAACGNNDQAAETDQTEGPMVSASEAPRNEAIDTDPNTGADTDPGTEVCRPGDC